MLQQRLDDPVVSSSIYVLGTNLFILYYFQPEIHGCPLNISNVDIVFVLEYLIMRPAHSAEIRYCIFQFRSLLQLNDTNVISICPFHTQARKFTFSVLCLVSRYLIL